MSGEELNAPPTFEMRNKYCCFIYLDFLTFVANQWNYERNGSLSPTEIMPNSTLKAWWRCNKGHEWLAVIESRNKGNGCPYCSGRYVIKGETDLQTVNSSLAKEWNYEKNNGLTPAYIMPNSHKQVWWVCNRCGNEYQTTVKDRNRGRICPECAKEKRKKKNT